MEKHIFTARQRAALLFLPADGSWTTDIKGMSAAVDSLVLYHSALARSEFGAFGPRGGWCRRTCLTDAGVQVRATLADITGETP